MANFVILHVIFLYDCIVISDRIMILYYIYCYNLKFYFRTNAGSEQALSSFQGGSVFIRKNSKISRNSKSKHGGIQLEPLETSRASSHRRRQSHAAQTVFWYMA